MGAPSRTNATTFSSYVQTVSGQQPQASLDPSYVMIFCSEGEHLGEDQISIILKYTALNNIFSEFPSLSNAPQPQNQNSAAHAVWANPPSRGNQSISTRRTPNQIPNSHNNSATQHDQQEQINVQQSTSNTSHGTNVNNDSRFANQSGLGQLSGLAQTQPGNPDDFPPLERTTSDDVDNERRPRGSQQSGAPLGLSRADISGSQSRNGAIGGQDISITNNVASKGDAAAGQGKSLQP